MALTPEQIKHNAQAWRNAIAPYLPKQMAYKPLAWQALRDLGEAHMRQQMVRWQTDPQINALRRLGSVPRLASPVEYPGARKTW
jgi:hypothetical protein